MNTTHYKKISHFVGLSGIGGVQSNFVEYMKNIDLNSSMHQHKVYTIGSIDPQYQFSIKVLNIKKILNLYKLVLDITSKDVIVHFYNNLSSLKVAFILFLLPTRRLIIHERGTVWNQSSKRWMITRYVAWKSSLILSNSIATKTMLVKKFSIPGNKITVIHNGIDTAHKVEYKKHKLSLDRVFHVGFIGRLDTHKGVHVLIDAMHYLSENNIKLSIAGDGPLKQYLEKQSSGLRNIEFMGRLSDSYSFISRMDLLVVPSIREPLGNICLEAGLCKVPVLAANIDGLPEIIKDHVSGELINPTDDIVIDIPTGAMPLPEFVVDPTTQEIHAPRQINSKILANKILQLSEDTETLERYSNQMYKKVIRYFSLKRYTLELDNIYQELI